MGEEAVAYAGEVPNRDVAAEIVVALLGWREANLILSGVSAGFSGDQLLPLVSAAEAIAGREPGSGPVATPASESEMHTGGIWDVLPALDDLPPGFVFVSDETLTGAP